MSSTPEALPAPAVDRLYRWLSDQWRGGKKPTRPVVERALRRTFAKLGGEVSPEEATPHSAPTRELVRHKGGAPLIETRDITGAELSAPRYRWEWSVDRMAAPLTAEEYQAATRLRNAYLMRQNTPGAVDPNGAGGSHPGSRLPIRDSQLKAAAEWNAIWLRLPPELRFVVTNFILEEAPRGQEHPLDAIEFGRMYGVTRDKEKARGVTVGALRATTAVIARLFREYDHWKAEQRERAAGQPQAVRRSRITDAERQMLTTWGK